MASKIQVTAGNVKIGGGAKVSIQSMLNVPADDIENSVKQAVELEKQAVRLSVQLFPIKMQLNLFLL